MNGKVDPRHGHKNHGDGLDQGVIEITEARIMGREAAYGDGREAVGDGIEGGHSREPVGARAENRQAQIDVPEGFRGLGNSRRQFIVFHGARRFGPVQLHPTYAQHRQNGHRQHDDSHSTKPLKLLAVKEDGTRQQVDPLDNRRTGGRESGYRLEHCVGHRHVRSVREQQWDTAAQSQRNPEHHDDDEAVAQAELSPVVPHR